MSSSKPLEILKFQNLGFLGSGSNAQVRKALFNNQMVAVKIFNTKNDAKSEVEYLKEVNELKKTSHSNIVKLIAFGKWQDKVDIFNCMVIELADVGSLHYLLYDTEVPYTLGHAVSWLRQCADAINYLHTRTPKPTIHRDLKPLNLLLMKGGILLKVCDFGTACIQKTIMTVNKGSPCWIAPEQLSHENYNEKCDVYSYTIIAWEVMVRLKPYFHLSNPTSTQIMYGVIKGTCRPKKISKCPKIFELLYDCGMHGDPNMRPSMSFVFEIMKTLDCLINKESIKPIVHQINENVSTDSSYLNKNKTGSISDSLQSVKSTADTVIKAHRYQDTLLFQNEDKSNENAASSSCQNKLSPSEDNVCILRNQTGRLSFNDNVQVNEIDISNNLMHNLQTNLKSHRRSKSYGNESIQNNNKTALSTQTDLRNQINTELNHRIETMLYQPIDPLYDNNYSILIFNKHRALIKEDERLQKSINSCRHQRDQLDSTIRNIKTYNELLKQKTLLQKENSKLRQMLN